MSALFSSDGFHDSATSVVPVVLSAAGRFAAADLPAAMRAVPKSQLLHFGVGAGVPW
jgi:hypothetical protein